MSGKYTREGITAEVLGHVPVIGENGEVELDSDEESRKNNPYRHRPDDSFPSPGVAVRPRIKYEEGDSGFDFDEPLVLPGDDKRRIVVVVVVKVVKVVKVTMSIAMTLIKRIRRARGGSGGLGLQIEAKARDNHGLER